MSQTVAYLAGQDEIPVEKPQRAAQSVSGRTVAAKRLLDRAQNPRRRGLVVIDIPVAHHPCGDKSAQTAVIGGKPRIKHAKIIAFRGDKAWIAGIAQQVVGTDYVLTLETWIGSPGAVMENH